ncbi:MAG: hypothetical protein M3Q60_23480 [Actinomycetota bacterium]|nr:hypothetical protein [Actinomycetota bacterium]
MTRRVTLREAARVLGISKEAVRKRVKRETLAHEKKDGVVYVFLPDGNVYLPAGGDAGTDTGTAAGGDAPDQQSEKSSAQNAHFADEDEEPGQNSGPVSEPEDDRDERIAELQETVRDLRGRLDRAEESIRDHIDHAEEANRENRRIIAALLERLPPQLEAPREPRDAPQAAPATPGGTEPQQGAAGPQTGAREHSNTLERPPEETARRPSWWRRIFGG